MAAPNNVYLDKCLINKVGSTEYKVLLAKPLAAYVSGVTGAEAQLTRFKELFKVDHVILVKDSAGNVGIEAFCKIGNNAEFHNWNTRLSHHRIMYNGEEYSGLNDGGLNTMGYAAVQDITDANQPVSGARPNVGEITIHFSVQAPYYSPCSVVIEKYTANGWTPVMQKRNYPAKYNGMDSVNIWAWERGLVQFRAVTTNEEGVMQSGTTSITVNAVMLNVEYNASADPNFAWQNKTAAVVYLENDVILYTPNSGSSQLWANEACTELAPNGTYFYEDYYYIQGWSAIVGRTQIIDSGKVQNLPSHPDYVQPDSLDSIYIEEYQSDAVLVDASNLYWDLKEIWVTVYNENDSAKTIEIRGTLLDVMSGNNMLDGGSVTVPANSSAHCRIHNTQKRVQTTSNELWAELKYNVQNMISVGTKEIDLAVNKEEK